MADDMVVLQCGSCSTRLKIRAVTARIMPDVKCPKCGKKVSTKSIAPAAPSAETPAVATPAAPAAPAPEPASAPAPVAEKPVEAPAPAPVAEPTPAPKPAPVAAPEPAPVVSAPVVAPAPVVVPPPAPVPPPVVAAPVPVVVAPPVDTEELKKARVRIAELEQQVQSLNAKVSELKAAVAPSTADVELVKARAIMAEQEERLSQLQQMWYEKEKEARTAYATAQRAQQERKFALDQAEGVLKAYHDAEIEAATDRINNLHVRLQQFLAQQAAARPDAAS